MKIYIDADGCPVVHLTVKIAKQFNIPYNIVCDTSHQFEPDFEVITVSKGNDSADFHIVNLVKPGDIVVTQDYGLAAICLAKLAFAINQNGLIYSADNIDALLNSRAESAKYRRAGGRTKGPKRRTPSDNTAFENSLVKLIKELQL